MMMEDRKMIMAEKERILREKEDKFYELESIRAEMKGETGSSKLDR